MSEERWLPVVGFEGIYSVSDQGRIRSEARTAAGPRGSIRERILKQYHRPGGYPSVSLNSLGRLYVKSVHILVLSAFSGQRPPGMDGCHNDDNAANNSLSNLRWDSRKNNIADVVKRGVRGGGELSANSKLSNAQASEIRTSPLSGVELARKFNVVPGVITNIRLGRTYQSA